MMLKKLWDVFTDRLYFLPIHPQVYLRHYERQAIRLAKTYAKGTLIDIGCGRMPYKKDLAPSIDRYIGLDHPGAYKRYKGNEKPDILADAATIPLPSGSVDTVLSISVLEHLEDPGKALREAQRILKKGGSIILVTIQSYPLHDKPNDFFRFTPYGLTLLFKKSGFQIVKIQKLGNFWVAAGQQFNVWMFQSIQEMLGSTLWILPAIVLLPVASILAFISNIVSFLLSPLDRTGNFALYNLIVAKKTISHTAFKKKQLH